MATDHAPHARHDKEHAFAEAAFGMLGLETALAVVLETMINSARMNWSELANRMLIMPAHVARLADQGRALVPVNRPISYSSILRPADRRPDASTSLSRNNPWHGRAARSGCCHHLGRPNHLPEADSDSRPHPGDGDTHQRKCTTHDGKDWRHLTEHQPAGHDGDRWHSERGDTQLP